MEQSGRRDPGVRAPRDHGAPAHSVRGSTPPDLEELLRRSQDKLRTVLPGGNLGGKGIALIALAAVAIWGFSGFFRVEPDELGVVLRFGKYVRDAKPGLNYHLPYPVESVLTPKVTRVNRIDIGMRLVEDLRRGTTMRDVPEESLMLTGDENIVDVDFSVFWLIKAGRRRRLPVQHPEPGRHREGGGRERHARGGRPFRDPADPHRRAADHRDRGAGADAEDARPLRLRHPGHAGPAAEGRSARAGDRFLPRRAGRAPTPSARRTRRRPTPTAWCRRRAAGPRRSPRRPKPIASRPSPRPTGQTSRFIQVYDEYKKAPDVTRQRMYLETMERLFGGTDKIILDRHQGGAASCPICRSTSYGRRGAPQPAGTRMRLNLARRRPRRPRHRGPDHRLRLAVHRLPDPAGAGGPARPAGARRHRTRA